MLVICQICGSTYRNNNREFENSLLANSSQKEASETLSTKCFEASKDEEKLNSDSAVNIFELPTEEEVRAARVNYFTRNADKQLVFGTS